MESREMTVALDTKGCLARSAADRDTGRSWRAYAALALGALLFIFTIWYQVYGDTRKDAAAWRDPVLQSHRQWRLRTAFLFLVWSILAGFCVPFGFGILVFVPVWLWFVYRVTRGMILFSLHRIA